VSVPTLEQIVGGIKTALDRVPGLDTYDHPPAAPPYPCAFPIPPEINYRLTMRTGVISLQFEIIVMVGQAAGHEQQLSLFPYLDWQGERSVFLALEHDRTLGLGEQVSAAVNNPARSLGLEEIGAYQAFGAAIPFLVAITNTPTL
jgi:hypothetical protein